MRAGPVIQQVVNHEEGGRETKGISEKSDVKWSVTHDRVRFIFLVNLHGVDFGVGLYCNFEQTKLKTKEV